MATTQTAPAPEDPRAEQSADIPAGDHEEIARLAYSYWEERQATGEGSPDDDWLRAERDYRSRQTAG